jgi:hypothetical protein
VEISSRSRDHLSSTQDASGTWHAEHGTEHGTEHCTHFQGLFAKTKDFMAQNLTTVFLEA